MYYFHLDQLNTPRFVTNSKAEVVWENQADVYGYEESEVSTTNTFTQPIRFQGQYLDEESGLHYNRYRYYSPKQQRFINQDPIGLVGGINHYQYAPNPVNWVDPFGLSCKENGWNTFQKNTKGHFSNSSEASKSYQKMKEVAALPLGEKPEISSYLPQSYIDSHAQIFNEQGGAFIVIGSWTENGRHPSLPPRKFVGLEPEMSELINKYENSNNDWKMLRDELNLGNDVDLGNDSILYVKIEPGDSRFSYEMPTGNEFGAIPGEWVPGGQTKSGTREAALIGSEKVVHNKSLEGFEKSFSNTKIIKKGK